MSTVTAAIPILDENPYAGHPELSQLEADLLWEYAKMAALVKQLSATTRRLATEPSTDLVAKLRTVETQMGLVLALFKASVWSTIVTAEQGLGEEGPSQAEEGNQVPLGEDESIVSDDYDPNDITPQHRHFQQQRYR